MTNAIRELFREEIVALGGRVTDEAGDDRALFARSLLPHRADVVPGDRVKGGIALRVVDGSAEVRPYVFREVCDNGAILAHSALGREIDLPAVGNPLAQQLEIRHAVRAAAAPEAFDEFVATMRESRSGMADVDMFISLLSEFTNVSETRLIDLMLRFDREGGSTYALGNATTALARDTADPALRWRLESVGARVFTLPRRPERARARATRRSQRVLH